MGIFFCSDDFHHLYVNSQGAITAVSACSFEGQANSNVNLYRPTTNWYFGLQHALFGANPLPYHVGLLLLQIVTVLLLYALLRGLGAPPLIACSATTFWSVLPCHVEPTTWPANICDTLVASSGTLALLSVLLYRRGGTVLYLGLAFAASIIALLSKEPGLGLIGPLMFLLLRKNDRRVMPQAVFLALPFVGYLVLRVGYSRYVQGLGTTVYYADPNVGQTFGYVANAMTYLWMLLVPHHQFAVTSVLGVLLLVLGAGVAVALRRKAANDDRIRTLLGLGAALVLSTMVPTILAPNIVDRYLHFPTVGIAFALAALLLAMQTHLPKASRFALGTVAATLLLYGPLTWSHVSGKIFAGRVSSDFVRAVGRLEEKGPVGLMFVPFAYDRPLGLATSREYIVNELGHACAIDRVFFGRDRPLEVWSWVVLKGTSPAFDLHSPSRFSLRDAELMADKRHERGDVRVFYFTGRDLLPAPNVGRGDRMTGARAD